VEGRPTDDADLVERARQGDVDAYGELVEMHSDLAFRTAFLVCGSAADAEDAAQEAFISAYTALPRFRAGAPFRPWLLRIVGNAARNRRRTAARRQRLAEQFAASLRTGNAAPSPEVEAEAAEERAALLRAISELRDEERDVVVMRHLLGLDVAETAAAAGCAEGTVKSRLSRGLGHLREQLERERV
jgi:RNA polymerase sigma factor (sigma-70 family)